jgi:hypothetical protein
MGLGPGHPGTGLPFFCHNGDPLSQPPPAHMGIPPYQLDPKGGEYWRAYLQWNRFRPVLPTSGEHAIFIPVPSLHSLTPLSDSLPVLYQCIDINSIVIYMCWLSRVRVLF